MPLLIALIILALIFGVSGVVQGLFWLISIGVILLLIAIAVGVSRTRSTAS